MRKLSPWALLFGLLPQTQVLQTGTTVLPGYTDSRLQSGEVTLASGVGSSPVVSGNAHPNCSTGETSAMASVKVSYTHSAGAWTVNFQGSGSDVIDFVCVGQP